MKKGAVKFRVLASGFYNTNSEITRPISLLSRDYCLVVNHIYYPTEAESSTWLDFIGFGRLTQARLKCRFLSRRCAFELCLCHLSLMECTEYTLEVISSRNMATFDILGLFGEPAKPVAQPVAKPVAAAAPAPAKPQVSAQNTQQPAPQPVATERKVEQPAVAAQQKPGILTMSREQVRWSELSLIYRPRYLVAVVDASAQLARQRVHRRAQT